MAKISKTDHAKVDKYVDNKNFSYIAVKSVNRRENCLAFSTKSERPI